MHHRPLPMFARYLVPTVSLALCAATFGCSDGDGDAATETNADGGNEGGDGDGDGYVVASVVITDAGRTTYVQAVDALEGHLTNAEGIEVAGNAVVIAEGRNVYVGLAEEPTWVKYSVDQDLQFKEQGRLSLAAYGLTYVDFGNAILDADTAVSISSAAMEAIVWNPETMKITGTIDLSHMAEEGYSLENWTTVAHDGLLYVPARWADWENARVLPKVQTTIIDPMKLEVVGIAEDDRCASGGRITFDESGYGYVMGDGRNYSAQMFANAKGETPPDNCILRIAPGETDFDEDFFVRVKDLTGGVESITELQPAEQGTGVAFAKMFYEDELPDGVEPIDFDFWSENAHKAWRIELGDEPTAVEVEGAPFSAIGFTAVSSGGLLWVGESEDGGGTSNVFAVDPATNEMTERFSMDGYFYALHPLE